MSRSNVESSTPEERAIFAEAYSKRYQGKNGQSMVEKGICTNEDIEKIVQAWKTFGAPETVDGYWHILNNEIICRKRV